MPFSRFYTFTHTHHHTLPFELYWHIWASIFIFAPMVCPTYYPHYRFIFTATHTHPLPPPPLPPCVLHLLHTTWFIVLPLFSLLSPSLSTGTIHHHTTCPHILTSPHLPTPSLPFPHRLPPSPFPTTIPTPSPFPTPLPPSSWDRKVEKEGR